MNGMIRIDKTITLHPKYLEVKTGDHITLEEGTIILEVMSWPNHQGLDLTILAPRPQAQEGKT